MRSTFNIKKYLILFILILILALPNSVSAQNKKLVNIYFFHSKDCTHCNSEIKFLDSIEKKYDNIRIYRYEVHNQENNQARLNILKLYNLKSNGVPLTIIGDTPYLGYTEESSNLKFIKTIEYYSRYGYQDKVGQLLQIKELSTLPANETVPTLEQFMETYGNYQLIGTLYTNDLDISSNANILGILSQINIIKIIALIIVSLLVTTKEPKKGLIYIMIYLMLSHILTIINTLTTYRYNLILSSLILVISILVLITICKTKHQKYLYILILIILFLTAILENCFSITPTFIFKELLHLHNLTGLNKISYYTNYLSMALIVNIIYILIVIFLNSSFFNKLIIRQKVSK